MILVLGISLNWTSFTFVYADNDEFSNSEEQSDVQMNSENSGRIILDENYSEMNIQTSDRSYFDIKWQESIMKETNGHYEFCTHIWCGNPLCAIKGVSGTVTYYDMSNGTTYTRNIYQNNFVGYNQYYGYFDSNIQFISGHQIKVTYSYNTIIVSGTAGNGGYRYGNLYFIVS